MLRRLLASAAALFLAFASEPAFARAPDLAAAVEAGDAATLEALAGSERGDRALLARGALSALRQQDREAIAALRAAAASHALEDGERRNAWGALAGIYLRQTRFAEAVAAYEAGRAFGPDPDLATEASTVQSLAFARALADAAPMQASIDSGGEARIVRDAAQLARANATINGRAQEAVLDTGAGYSTASQSAAERLGLRFLEAQVTVGSATSEAVPARLAIADTLVMAGGRFRNVVFIVLPDAALSFAGGAYRIDAIVGLPVLLRFGRIEFVRDQAGEVLRHRSSRRLRQGDMNLLLDGLQPIALVRAEGANAPLRMFIDTGAGRSKLSPRAASEFPQLVESAVRRTTTIGGAGGELTDADALSIPHLTFTIGATSVRLDDVRVLSDSRNRRHGAIGQDLLRSGSGYAIDFGAMRFELLPARQSEN
jgi:hypothetical protein